MVTYPAMLDVSRELIWFRDRPNLTRHGKAFGISQATAYRYLHEVIDVLADRAPSLRQALERAATDGLPP